MPENYFQSSHHPEVTEQETKVEETRKRSGSFSCSTREQLERTKSLKRSKSMAGESMAANEPLEEAHSEHDGSGSQSSHGETRTAAASPVDDVLLVDWDGPDDTANPKNWAFKRKWAATIIVSSFTFVSPLSSSMIAPASVKMGDELGIHDPTILALSTSIFILGYALGPLFIGPLSEIFGRSIVLQLSNLFYLAWNTGCGFSKTKGQLLAFRLLSGIGGSAPLSIGGGVLGDIWKPEERGQAISIYSLAPLLGPVLGPIMGSWIAERTTWRWVFWSTSIFDVVIQFLGVLFLQETYAPVLLERKAKLLRRQIAEDPDTEKGLVPKHVRTVYEDDTRTWSHIFGKALTRPFLIFAREPIIQLLGVFMAFVYGTLYLFLTTIPSIFEGRYHEQPGIAGLHYIAMGVGLTGASQINARVLDRLYKYLKDKNGGKHKPEYRLPPVVPASILLPAGLFLSGWAAQARLHWIVVDIGLALVGGGIILTFQSIQTYVIDAFTLHAASALAAVSCLRSLAGFGFPLLGPPMYTALGFGKGNSILAGAAILFGCPTPWLLWKYGERIRMASRYAKK